MLLMRHFCPFARRTGLESMVKPAECRGCGAVTFDKTRFLSKVWPPPRHSWLEVDLATDDTTVGSTPIHGSAKLDLARAGFDRFGLEIEQDHSGDAAKG